MIHSSSLPPRNAVRHGLSSSLHIPEERIRYVENIRAELLRIHQPQSDEERDCISELALARWKTLEFDRQLELRTQAEFEQAGMIFDRQRLDQFEIDEKLWHSNPRFRRDLLGHTFHGASLFEQLWSEILAALNSTIQKISLQQARNMALLLGSSSNFHELSRDGLWLFSRFLKMESNAAQTIKVWAILSNTTLVAGDSSFIDHHFFSDAHPATCHKDLKERATQEHKFWVLRKRDLEMEYATRRKQFAEMSMGTGLGDPKLANDARLALRYQITAQNRADKLVRRLDGLKRHRGLVEYRSNMAEEREARRLERQSREESAAYVMVGDVEDQDQDDEMIAHNIESVLEDLTALVGQIKPDSDDTQDLYTEEDAPAVQNEVVDQPVEIESRLQARIDRMMKGRSRSERARIRKQFTAMNKESELAGSIN